MEMKSCGIIAEYNPFHNGHRYQLQKARRLTQSDVMIVAMSGNFLQRGEPALIDKWKRAEIALKNGADLVVELPVLGSAQSTDLFAKAGIRILQSLDCTSYSFGVEQGRSSDFIQMAQFTLDHQKQIDEVFQTIRNDGRSYPAQIEQAIREVAGETIDLSLFNSPNNLLGLAYEKENRSYSNPMRPFAIQRKGANHHDTKIKKDIPYASGTAIRKEVLNPIFQGELSWINWVPKETVKAIEKNNLMSWENYWPYLRYHLILRSAEELSSYYQVEEGIEHRLKKFALPSNSFYDFINRVKTKRWTWARLQRVCLYLLIGISKNDVESFFGTPPAIRILGFTEVGSKYLKELKKDSNTVMISNVSQKNKHHLY